MRIAIFTETFLPATDGVVTRLRHTLEEFARMGDQVLVVAPAYGEGPAFYEGFPIYRVPSVPLPPYPQIRVAPALPGVGHALRGFKPDLIHAVNPIILGWGAYNIARRLDVPLVTSYHTNVAEYANYYKLGLLVRAARWHNRKVHNRARLTLCTSEATRRYLMEEGIKNVRLWPQGVDSHRFRPDLFSKRWRGKLTDGNPESRLVLYVGRVGWEKGIENLKELVEALPDTRLAIVGDGPARKDMEKLFAGTPTIFTGILRGRMLSRAYASGDVFVFPSTTDTLGMSMIEALASGLPVVAARSGASHEVVSEGENGLLYEPGSGHALISAVDELLSDQDLRSRMSTAASRAAKERSWEDSTSALRSYYEQVIHAQ